VTSLLTSPSSGRFWSLLRGWSSIASASTWQVLVVFRLGVSLFPSLYPGSDFGVSKQNTPNKFSIIQMVSFNLFSITSMAPSLSSKSDSFSNNWKLLVINALATRFSSKPQSKAQRTMSSPRQHAKILDG